MSRQTLGPTQALIQWELGALEGVVKAWCATVQSPVAYRGGGLGCSKPPEIPKAFQNRAKLNLTVKTVEDC